MEKKAILLASGGLDSTTVAAMAQAQGFTLYALTVFYGQRHDCEIEAAKRVASALKFREHRFLDIPIAAWGGSTLLAGASPAVPTHRSTEAMAQGIPSTYVPARNTIFLSLALSWAEAVGAEAIFLGVNAVDYSGYPDCRPEFLQAFEHLARLGTKAGVENARVPKIHAPLLRLSKAEIIRQGMALGVDYALTHSCYAPTATGLACGVCDSCTLRRKGFAEAGFSDPLAYAT